MLTRMVLLVKALHGLATSPAREVIREGEQLSERYGKHKRASFPMT